MHKQRPRLGINDLVKGHSVDEIILRYSTLLDCLVLKTQNINVISVLPVTGRRARFNRHIKESKTPLANIAQAKGATCVDIRSKFVDSMTSELDEKHSVDGGHLIGGSHRLLCQEIAPFTNNDLK